MSSTSSSRRSATPAPASACASSSLSATKTLPSSAIPGRNPVAPPELARHAPGLDVLQPVEPGLLPGLGHDRGCRPSAPPRSPAWPASPHRHTIGRSASGSITTPERSPNGVWMMRGSSCSLPSLSMRVRTPLPSASATTALAAPRSGRGRASLGAGSARRRSGRSSPSASSMLSMSRGLEARALADLEIVEIMPRRDLHRARAEFRIGMLVGDDRDQPAGDRQPDLPCRPARW